MFKVLTAHELIPDDRDMILQIMHNLITITTTLELLKRKSIHQIGA